MKNYYVEKRKREAYWSRLTNENKFVITQAFVQVFGGEPDKELEEMVRERLIAGEVSTKFLDTVLDWSKTGNGNLMMTAKFADQKERGEG